MAHLDRLRAQRLMAAEQLDGLILLSPEAFGHATGAAAGVATMWRQAGAVAVLIPADAGLPETAVVSDLFAPMFRRSSHIRDLRENPIWVEAMTLPHPRPDLKAAPQFAPLWVAPGRPPGNQRPETYDPLVCYRHLRDALAENGLQTARIGIELGAISARDYPALMQTLAPAHLCDGTAVARGVRAVKSAAEIALLRAAVTVAETGIIAVRDAVTPGIARSDLTAIWQQTVRTHSDAARMTGDWNYISVGPDPWGGDAIARAGDLVKVDVGCVMGGYTSDSGRTFVIGAPNDLQASLHDALDAGFAAGLALLHPGVPLSEVHRATQAAIRAKGLAGYSRGHFGHSLGTGPGSEEWPFISATATALIEPGMVMAFECPLYVNGVGGMIIEDQIEITADGPVVMNRLSRALVVC